VGARVSGWVAGEVRGLVVGCAVELMGGQLGAWVSEW
jgi:hypothetical protein